MSIHQKIRIIQRAEAITADLKSTYALRTEAAHDLQKLSDALKQLLACLENLDHLQPDHTTNEIEGVMRSVDLDNTILQGELQPADYKRLNKAIKAVKAALKFHPTKYSLLEFVALWFYELLYFV